MATTSLWHIEGRLKDLIAYGIGQAVGGTV